MKYILAVASDGEHLLQKIHLPIDVFIYHRSSIRQASHLVSEALPDLVLIEHALQDGLGLTVVEALRSHEGGRHVPVVVLGADEPSGYERLGCHYFLPVQPKASELNRALWEFL